MTSQADINETSRQMTVHPSIRASVHLSIRPPVILSHHGVQHRVKPCTVGKIGSEVAEKFSAGVDDALVEFFCLVHHLR